MSTKYLCLILASLLLLIGANLFADEAAQKVDTAAAPDAAAPGSDNSVNAHDGRGILDNSWVPTPGQFVVDYVLTKSREPGLKTLRQDIVVRYGLKVYNQPLEVLCDIPASRYSGPDASDDGSSTRGAEPINCGIKWVAYSNEKTGTDFTLAETIQNGHMSLGHMNPGADRTNYATTAAVFSQTFLNQSWQMLVNVAVTRDIDGHGNPSQTMVGAGVGHLLNKDNSVSAEVVRFKTGPDKTNYLATSYSHGFNCGNHSCTIYVTAAKGSGNKNMVLSGFEIADKPSDSRVYHSTFGGKPTVEDAIREATNPTK